jgi:hypothetical protein
MKKLLIERTSHIEVPTVSLQESIDKNNGRLIIRNVLLQRADTPNKNKRVYPKRVLERELNTYFKEQIKNNCAYGHLDHPSNEDPNGSVVLLERACQIILDAKWRGNDIIGDIEVLQTPLGNIVRNILLAGHRVGQSSRGLGSVEPLREGDDEIVEVQDDFSLIVLADCVSNPSTFNADMSLKENEFINENTIISTYKTSKIDLLIQDIICDLSGICCMKK